MDKFHPNQRYTSKGEPELGIGIVIEASLRLVKLHFPIADETRIYALESAPLRRVVFKSGDTIEDINKQRLLIERVEHEDGLYLYYGNGKRISEADLGNMSANYGADDRLFMGDVDTPQDFALRRDSLLYDYQRKTSPVRGLLGGRIDLIPHQLYIAHEVSSRYAPRVLLSDQVGLGKTIEACLIIHRLLLSGQISRVLILVPESLVHQWFVEVLRKFNLWFHIFDESRCLALDNNAPEGNPFLANQLIICSTDFLTNSEQRSHQAIRAGWDMLVVDEAHHLEWSLDHVSREYAVVELLSKETEGLLLLTATPEQLGEEGHFARLRLLDPSRYATYEDFIKETSEHQFIAEIIEQLHSGKDLHTDTIKALESVFSKERLQSIVKEEDAAKDNLIEDLLDLHGPGRVLFRNTRASMGDFPKRIVHLTPLKATKDHSEWLRRLTHEFTHDIEGDASVPEQELQFKGDPRIQWLLKTLKTLNPAKIVLICKSKEKVLAIENVLIKRGHLKIGVFHEDLTIVQRDKNAAWFSEPDGAQILLCSEIGSEGRNFQFTHHLVLFDVPLGPELLEQRIGRLDRIGQTEDIHIHVPYLPQSPQHQLIRWFHEGLNAFEKNIEGGYHLFNFFGERLLHILKSESIIDSDLALETLIEETSTAHHRLKAELAQGRDKLLELNSFRPQVAEKLIKHIQKEDRDKKLEVYLTKVFRYCNMEMEDLAMRTYFLHPASITTEIFPSIPREGISVTFDRKQALNREDISFLSWDHPLATESIDLILSSGVGSASFGMLRNSNNPGILLELLYVLETSSKKGIVIDRFLPNTPLRIVVDFNGTEVTEIYPTDLFDKNLISGPIDHFLDNDHLVEMILPNMISAATKIAEARRSKEIEKGMRNMTRTMTYEINRLKQLQQNNNNIRSEEIQMALAEQLALEDIIKNARLRLDALQLIVKE